MPVSKSIYFPGPSGKQIPAYIHPMLAKIAENPFDSDEWIFEIKWDGYRAITEKSRKIKFYSRNGIPLTDKYPSIAKSLEEIEGDFIIDGEVVAFDDTGKPSFQQLQHLSMYENPEIAYYIFDLLRLQKKNTQQLPLAERKALLETLLPREHPLLRYCSHIPSAGIDFFNAAVESGLEGIIAKKSDSRYHPGLRTGEWLKIRNHKIDEAIIVGYTAPSGERKYFGSLLLAVRKRGKLKYAVNVGTGFNDKTLREVYQLMQPLKTSIVPLKEKTGIINPITWIRPMLVANIKYSEITRDGKFRHPVFQGLRFDKSAREI